jgi:arginine repressor
MGTIAGENTILVIPRDIRQISKLKEQLTKVCGQT